MLATKKGLNARVTAVRDRKERENLRQSWILEKKKKKKSVPGREDGKCKGPEVGRCSACSRNHECGWSRAS